MGAAAQQHPPGGCGAEVSAAGSPAAEDWGAAGGRLLYTLVWPFL